MKFAAAGINRGSKQSRAPNAYQQNKRFEIFHGVEIDKKESCSLRGF
jgi:hypothetical protein